MGSGIGAYGGGYGDSQGSGNRSGWQSWSTVYGFSEDDGSGEGTGCAYGDAFDALMGAGDGTPFLGAPSNVDGNGEGQGNDEAYGYGYLPFYLINECGQHADNAHGYGDVFGGDLKAGRGSGDGLGYGPRPD